MGQQADDQHGVETDASDDESTQRNAASENTEDDATSDSNRQIAMRAASNPTISSSQTMRYGIRR